MIAVLCAALSGAMFYLSQGVDDVWWLAWFAPAPLLWLAYGDAPRWQVFAASLAAFAAGQFYMVQCYGAALVVSEIAMMFGVGALFAGAVLLSRQMRLAVPAAALVAFPAVWTAAEYLVGVASPHGSFGSIAYSQVSFPAAIQLAALLGMYAVTFLICLFANALALGARGAREAGAAGVALCALCLAYGVAQLAAPQVSAIRVAALGDEGKAYRKAFRGDVDAALAVTREYADAVRAGAARGTHVFVTPEGGVSVTPEVQARVLAPLAAAAKDTHSLILAGTLSRKPDRNMALGFHPAGPMSVYDKRHPLMPLESRFTPGKERGLLGPGRATVICKDMDFAPMIRDDAVAAGGIRLMLVPAGDFMKDDWIHARMAIMRGVENGFAMVRSSFNGLETISDAEGRVVARGRIDHAGLIVTEAAVEPGSGDTLYMVIGDAFAWAAVLLSAVLAGFTYRASGKPTDQAVQATQRTAPTRPSQPA